MRTYESACSGCPECVSCGRKNEYYEIIECDKCGGTSDLYDFNGRELCLDCIREEFGEYGTCEECREEAILIDGLCIDCMELDEITD